MPADAIHRQRRTVMALRRFFRGQQRGGIAGFVPVTCQHLDGIQADIQPIAMKIGPMLPPARLGIDHAPHLIPLLRVISIAQHPVGQRQRRLKRLTRALGGRRHRSHSCCKRSAPATIARRCATRAASRSRSLRSAVT